MRVALRHPWLWVPVICPCRWDRQTTISTTSKTRRLCPPCRLSFTSVRQDISWISSGTIQNEAASRLAASFCIIQLFHDGEGDVWRFSPGAAGKAKDAKGRICPWYVPVAGTGAASRLAASFCIIQLFHDAEDVFQRLGIQLFRLCYKCLERLWVGVPFIKKLLGRHIEEAAKRLAASFCIVPDDIQDMSCSYTGDNPRWVIEIETLCILRAKGL
mgnify:CR=1 FL=1